MTKKSIITYLGSPSSIPTNIINQVPNFEQSGVKYQGFYKIDKGNGNFELKKQLTRFYFDYLQATNSHLYTRPNPTQTFFASMINISYNIAAVPAQIIIYDGVAAVPRIVMVTSATTGNIQLDLSSSPRKFSGTGILTTYSAGSYSGSDYIGVCLYGWDDE